MAALLEQQRHIIRIYDLALETSTPISEALLPLRTFRPQVVVIASDDAVQATVVEAALDGSDMKVMWLGTSLREITSEQVIDQVQRLTDGESEKNIIFDALLALDNLDTLPFPARHLVSLEQYPLCRSTGELQTTVVLARRYGTSSILLRQPALIIAELSNIVREYGIRHFIFLGPPITHNKE